MQKRTYAESTDRAGQVVNVSVSDSPGAVVMVNTAKESIHGVRIDQPRQEGSNDAQEVD